MNNELVYAELLILRSTLIKDIKGDVEMLNSGEMSQGDADDLQGLVAANSGTVLKLSRMIRKEKSND